MLKREDAKNDWISNWFDFVKIGTCRTRTRFALFPYYTYINKYWLRFVKVKSRWNGCYWEEFEVEDETIEGYR